MGKVEKFDKTNVKTILQKCEDALQPIADEFGLDLQRKSCRYRDMEMPVAFLLQATVVDDDGKVLDKQAQEFKKYASLYGLKPEHLGKTVLSMGKVMTVVGLNTRNRKFPILCLEPKTSKRFKLTAESVRSRLTTTITD
jgi:hypothetical protein